MNLKKLIPILILLVIVYSCKKDPQSPPVPQPLELQTVAEQRAALAGKKFATPIRLLDSIYIVTSLAFISSEQSEGRNENTPGHARVEEYIKAGFYAAGADSLKKSFLHSFVSATGIEGRNYLAKVKGSQQTDSTIVITAHYDHLGKNAQGQVYNGADDNASGVACLLGLAKYISKNPIKYPVLLIATDMEEDGFRGAVSIVDELKKMGLLSKTKLNINLDMIARSDKNEIFAVGTKEFPQLKYLIDGVQSKTNTNVIMGHDGRGAEPDWSLLSDHAAFRSENIPYLYFGVEDHADYHQISDDFEKINLNRYIENCNLILQVLQMVK